MPPSGNRTHNCRLYESTTHSTYASLRHDGYLVWYNLYKYYNSVYDLNLLRKSLINLFIYGFRYLCNIWNLFQYIYILNFYVVYRRVARERA